MATLESGGSDEVQRCSAGPAARRLRELGWWGYERLPGFADRLIRLGQTWGAPILRPRVELRRLQGGTRAGQPGSVLVAGAGPAIDYLLARFFAAAPRVEAMGSASLLALPDRLRREGGDDLVLARVPQPLARWLFDDRFLRLPEAVDAWLGLDRPDPLADANEGIRRNLRKVRDAAVTWSEAHDPADFEEFYGAYYRPFVRARFGAQAVMRERSVLRRAFRRGAILWIERGGRRIGASLVQIDGRTLRLIALAAHDVEELRRSRLLPAWTLCAIEYANGRGLTRVDLGASLPSLRDGVLAHKRGWGARLAARPASHHDIVLRWPGYNPRVARFLADVPLLFQTRAGFRAVSALTGGEPAQPAAATRLWRQLAPAGLDGLYVMAARWAPDGSAPAAPQRARVWLAPPGPPEVMLRSARPCPR